MLTQLAPTPARFRVIGWACRYGSRDEVTHAVGVLIGTAYTRRFAERLAWREADALGPDTEIVITITDARPDLAEQERQHAETERRIAEHAAWPHRDDYDPEFETDGDLPF